MYIACLCMSVYIHMHYIIFCWFQQDRVIPARKAMQPTQGRTRQYEEEELPAEETGHLRARSAVSDAVYNQCRCVSFWELLSVGTWPDFGYMTPKSTPPDPLFCFRGIFFFQYYVRQELFGERKFWIPHPS